MDLSKFEEAKKKWWDRRAQLLSAKETAHQAEIAVDRAKFSVNKAADEVRRAFILSGGLAIAISPKGARDSLGNPATTVTVQKTGMRNNSEIGELLEPRQIALASHLGKALIQNHLAFGRIPGGLVFGSDRAWRFSKLVSILLKADVLCAHDELVAYGGSFFVREDYVWKELGRDMEEVE